MNNDSDRDEGWNSALDAVEKEVERRRIENARVEDGQTFAELCLLMEWLEGQRR